MLYVVISYRVVYVLLLSSVSISTGVCDITLILLVVNVGLPPPP